MKTTLMFVLSLLFCLLTALFAAYTHWVLFYACHAIDPVEEAPAQERVKERT